MPVRRPAPLSAGLAVAIALGTVALLHGGRIAAAALIEGVGCGVLGAGVAGVRRGWRVTGGVVAAGGAGVAAGALVWGLGVAGDAVGLLTTLPGYLGAVVLFLGVMPLYGSGSRWLVKAGAGLVLAGVLLAGLLNSAGFGSLLLATAGSVVAWDLGENAIGIGEQLGRETPTARIEGVHALGSVAVGGVAVWSVQFASGWTPADASLSSVLVLLLAVLAFTVALHE